MATMTIEGYTAEISFDEDLREFEGMIELEPSERFGGGVACFTGRSVDELEANASEVLRHTLELLRA